MVIPPKYQLTPKIVKLLQRIEVLKEIINSIPIQPEIEINIRRQSTLKSSLYSARIEGNILTLDNLTGSIESRQKKEVFNILKALNSINKKHNPHLTSAQILKLHQIVMNGLIDKNELGRFRSEPSAIFNSAGQAIYLAPRPNLVPSLINQLVDFTNSNQEQIIPIQAALSHFAFEKIHPFIDGNGRVGRLLIQIVLAKNHYNFKGLLSLEEFLDNNRQKYYEYLEKNDQDITEFVEFILEAIANSANTIKEQILKKDVQAEDLLLPRRTEILNIIRDQQLVNFDQIRRRFLLVNERTLRYDLKKLADAGLIRKLGTTKGVYYQPIQL